MAVCRAQIWIFAGLFALAACHPARQKGSIKTSRSTGKTQTKQLDNISNGECLDLTKLAAALKAKENEVARLLTTDMTLFENDKATPMDTPILAQLLDRSEEIQVENRSNLRLKDIMANTDKGSSLEILKTIHQDGCRSVGLSTNGALATFEITSVGKTETENKPENTDAKNKPKGKTYTSQRSKTHLAATNTKTGEKFTVVVASGERVIIVRIRQFKDGCSPQKTVTLRTTSELVMGESLKNPVPVSENMTELIALHTAASDSIQQMRKQRQKGKEADSKPKTKATPGIINMDASWVADAYAKMIPGKLKDSGCSTPAK